MARYKVLKSVAHSFGHSFTSLMNYRGDDYVMGHLLRRAREVCDGSLRLDILSGEVVPTALLTRDVRESLAAYCAWFPRLVEAHRTHLAHIRAAHMSITFDLATERPNRHFPEYLESPYVCRVEIEDDRGKLWVAELRDWWFPEAGTPTPGPGARPSGEGGLRIALHRLGRSIRSRWLRGRPSARAAA